MYNPFDIEHEATHYWEEELENDIETIHFFHHEIMKNEIMKELYSKIDEHLKQNQKFSIDRIVGFANKKNGDKNNISDYEYACMFCYAVYSKINVINRVKFMMDLFNTSRINVLNMLSGHFYMKFTDNKEYDWYFENYLEVEFTIEDFFKNKYKGFVPQRKRGKPIVIGDIVNTTNNK